MKYFSDCPHKEEEAGAERGNKENSSNKTCHRNDGQSVCYCCTIFGYTVIEYHLTRVLMINNYFLHFRYVIMVEQMEHEIDYASD